MRAFRIRMTFAGLAVLLAVMMVLSIGIGTVSIPPAGVLQALTGRGGSEEVRNIVMTLRLPRTLMAAVLGGALSVSGCLLQTFFANPIAGPFILGISSGAKMAVAATMILIIGSTGRSSNLMIVAAAFAGALISTSFIILVSKKVRHIGSLLAAGIMIGYICSAVTDLMVTFAEDQDIVNLHSWSQGSFSGVTWDGVAFASVLVAVVFACTMLLSKPIGAFQMGEHYARSMGVNGDGLRGPDFLCGHRRAVSGERTDADGPSGCGAAGCLSRRSGFLCLRRSARPDHARADGAQHQYGHVDFRRADRDFHADPESGKQEDVRWGNSVSSRRTDTVLFP